MMAMQTLIVRDASGRETRGVDPRRVDLTALRAAGHHGGSMMRVIRAKCLDCSAGNRAEVAACTAVGCALWPYRMGSNPFKRRGGAGNPASSDESGECGEAAGTGAQNWATS
jgi:hypothetical protein